MILRFLPSWIAGALGLHIVWTKSIPFVDKHYHWSIGIYSGSDGVHFAPQEEANNPVLTARHVTDITARFLADPFMIKEGNRWYMFFEMYNGSTKKGDIGLAESEDGLRWHYVKRVLEEPFHLSYPLVFKWQDSFYLVPEVGASSSVRLYKAQDFPTRWVFVKTLIEGMAYKDATFFFHQNKWWCFVSTCKETGDALHLFFSDDLEGPWVSHPKSPLLKDNWRGTRLAGRVVDVNGKLVRFAQDGHPYYGKAMCAFEIVRLTSEEYEEREIPDAPISSALPKHRWNRNGTHHIDSHLIGENQWLACVDGFRHEYFFGPGRRMALKFMEKWKV